MFPGNRGGYNDDERDLGAAPDNTQQVLTWESRHNRASNSNPSQSTQSFASWPRYGGGPHSPPGNAHPHQFPNSAGSWQSPHAPPPGYPTSPNYHYPRPNGENLFGSASHLHAYQGTTTFDGYHVAHPKLSFQSAPPAPTSLPPKSHHYQSPRSYINASPATQTTPSRLPRAFPEYPGNIPDNQVYPADVSRSGASATEAASILCGEDSEITEGNEKKLLQAYGASLRRKKCSQCKKVLLPTKDSWLKILRPLTLTRTSYAMAVSCKICKAQTCFGCGQPYSETQPSSKRLKSSWCCEEGQLFQLWAWLCSLEDDVSYGRGVKVIKPKNHQSGGSSRQIEASPTVIQPKGTGYGGKEYSFEPTDVHPDYMMPSLSLSMGSRKRSKKNAPTKPVPCSKEDSALSNLFNALAKLLPTPFTASSPDSRYLQLVTAMIRRSNVLEEAATLLRTTNLDDVVQQHNLYNDLISFLSRLVGHFSLSHFVGNRVLFSRDARIPEISMQPSNGQDGVAGDERQQVQSLSDLYHNFAAILHRMEEQAALNLDDFDSIERQRIIDICDRVFSLETAICEASKASEGSSKMKGKERASDKAPGLSLVKDLAQWHREICVEAIEDDVLQATYYFNVELKRKGTPGKGRMKRLVTELASLQSSLPEGIFIRHGTARLDTMRILIVGPKDTPYDQGLFEFDLYCPMDYPQRPPMMQFRTTGRGRAHFNPNLYQDGKVCLSLLGTWNGPGWSNESTLLQVLVSIQAMIFCEEPWYNEPGRETRRSNDASQRYNSHIHALTVQYALTDWLKTASRNCNETEHPIWHAIIQKHFRVFGSQILGKIKEWEKKAPETPKRPRFFNLPVPPAPHGASAKPAPAPPLHPYLSDMGQQFSNAVQGQLYQNVHHVSSNLPESVHSPFYPLSYVPPQPKWHGPIAAGGEEYPLLPKPKDSQTRGQGSSGTCEIVQSAPKPMSPTLKKGYESHDKNYMAHGTHPHTLSPPVGSLIAPKAVSATLGIPKNLQQISSKQHVSIPKETSADENLENKIQHALNLHVPSSLLGAESFEELSDWLANTVDEIEAIKAVVSKFASTKTEFSHYLGALLAKQHDLVSEASSKNKAHLTFDACNYIDFVPDDEGDEENPELMDFGGTCLDHMGGPSLKISVAEFERILKEFLDES